MAPLNLNAQRTAALGIPGFDHGEYFADPTETRGIRNNNPGNIEMVSRDPSRSAMHSEFGRLGSDGRFAVYSTPIGGIAANFEVLNDMQSRRGLNTLAQIVSAWAPPNENNTKAYIAAVSKATGIGPNDKLPSFFSRPDVAASILSAKYSVENGINPYDKSTILAGVEMARDAQSRNFSKMDSISERGAMARNMEELRQAFRGPTDYGAPVWDGTYSPEPNLAAPVGAVSMSALPDLPSAPGPDLGANLSSMVPSSDFTPSVSPYGFSGMSYSPGMGQVQDQLSQTYAGTVPGGGAFVPDAAPRDATLEAAFSTAPIGPAQSFGSFTPSFSETTSFSGAAAPEVSSASVSPTGFGTRDMGSLGSWGGFGEGITPETAPAAPAYERSVSLGYQPGFAQEMGSLGRNPGFGGGITPNAAPSIGPTSFSSANMIDPGMTGAFGLTGIAGLAPSSPSTQTWGIDGITQAPARPNTVAATQPELPGFTLPPDVVPPTTVTAAPSRVGTPAPALSAPQPVRSFSVREAAPAPSQREQTAPQTRTEAPAPMTPEAWLGGVMRGGSAAVPGMDNYGLASMARAGDQYAQPAMLGLERSYANATGQAGPKGLFDGIFGGSLNVPSFGMPNMGSVFTGQNVGRVGGALAGGMIGGPLGALAGGLLGNYVGGYFSGGNQGGISDGFGAVRDATTGAILGGFDPSDPAHNGYAGWGEGWSSGGNTPGAGGLY